MINPAILLNETGWWNSCFFGMCGKTEKLKIQRAQVCRGQWVCKVAVMSSVAIASQIIEPGVCVYS